MRVTPLGGWPFGNNPPNTPKIEENIPIGGIIERASPVSDGSLNISGSTTSKVVDVATESLFSLPSSSSSPPPSPPSLSRFPSQSSSSGFSSLSSSEGDAPPNPPNGLKRFLEDHGRPPFIARPGRYHPEEILFGGYLYLQDKRFGVEPGFEAVKMWTARDNALLQHPDLAVLKPKYYHAIHEFIREKLAQDPVYQYLAEKAGDDYIDVIRMSNNAHVNETMRLYANEHILKFHKRHYIKLDYAEPESGTVSIPLERAKTVSDKYKESNPLLSDFLRALRFVDGFAQCMHQLSRRALVRDMNLGAIKEALANDIYEAWGFGGQNLRIRHSQYQNGQSKLLLDGAEVQGRLGEAFSTLEGQIKYGQLVGNCVRDEEGRLYPLDSGELGRAKVKSLLTGDFDKVGSRGGNLGFIVENGQAKLKNIDPGKALEEKYEITQDDDGYRLTYRAFGKTDRMTQRNLHTDLSFDQPLETVKDKAANGYKNFTIFDDTLLSEKLQGMKDVLDHWGQTRFIFQEYIRAFDGSDGNADLSFKRELEETFNRLSNRKQYFEEVLSERLGILELGPEKLDFLDNLEKLTSDTVDHVGPDSDFVGLRHLRVIPESRKEWHMIKKDDGSYLLWFAGKEGEAITTRVRLQEFLLKDPSTSVLQNKITRSGELLSIYIDNEDELSSFMEAVSEVRIANHKNQKLMI